MNEVTSKVRTPRKNIALLIDAHTVLSDYAKDKHLSITQVLENLIEWLPVYDVCNKQGLTIDAAIAKLAIENKPVVGKVWNDKPVSTKTMDKFSDWLTKLYNHNVNSKVENRVFITQRLLLNLTNGNVNMISKAFKEKEAEIMAHNANMGIDETTNRKLSHKIRDEYGTVSNWLTIILA